MADYADYYDRAEQIFRGELVEQTFRITPAYLAVLRKCIEQKVAKENKVIAMSSPVEIETTSGSGNVTVSLGKFNLTPGAYMVRLQSDSERRFMADSVDIEGPDGAQNLPAATWMSCSTSDVSAGSKAKVTPGSWNGAAYSMCGSDITSGLRNGIPITARVPITVAAPGAYTLKARVVKSVDVGMIQFAIDGHALSLLDCYQTQPNSDWSLESAGSCALTAGAHLVTLTWTAGSKNPASTGCDVFCDYVTLDDGTTKFDLEDYCQDGLYDVNDKQVYGWTLNSDSTCQPGFHSPALAYFANGRGGMSLRVPFVVHEAGEYEISANATKSLCGANGSVSATLCRQHAFGEFDAAEVDRRYEAMVKLAQRMIGQQMGLCGFPDWVNELPSDLDPDLPGIHMQGCCEDATIRGSHAVWSETVTGDTNEARVNMAFNRQSPLLDVASCLPHRGELTITVKSAQNVLVRVPSWADKDKTQVYVDKQPIQIQWNGRYVRFADTRSGQLLTVTYPVRMEELKETVGSLHGVEFTERWRGNTIVDIAPPGKWIPMFHRPELDTDLVPE
jgi:hypothetical protein